MYIQYIQENCVIFHTEGRTKSIKDMYGAGNWCMDLCWSCFDCHPVPQDNMVDLLVLFLLHQTWCDAYKIHASGIVQAFFVVCIIHY